MLRVNELSGFGAGGTLVLPLIEHLEQLGLLTNLKLVLDAGDPLSAPSSPTKWLDRSGGGYDFNLGTSTSSQSIDPVFHGTVGKTTDQEYWTFDGTQYFQYDTSNEAWMDNFHKNNATFTILMWLNIASGGVPIQSLWTTTYANKFDETGIILRINGSRTLNVTVRNTSSTEPLIKSTSMVVPIGEWAFVSLTIDEAAGTGAFVVNSSAESFVSTYASPTNGSSSQRLKIGHATNAFSSDDYVIHSGSYMAMVAAWENIALSVSDIDRVYQITRTRFNV